jgi:hypothetical protein
VSRTFLRFLTDHLASFFHPSLVLLERTLEEDLAFLKSCGLTLASKPLLRAVSSRDSSSRNTSQVMDVVNGVLWINLFPLEMQASHWAS